MQDFVFACEARHLGSGNKTLTVGEWVLRTEVSVGKPTQSGFFFSFRTRANIELQVAGKYCTRVTTPVLLVTHVAKVSKMWWPMWGFSLYTLWELQYPWGRYRVLNIHVFGRSFEDRKLPQFTMTPLMTPWARRASTRNLKNLEEVEVVEEAWCVEGVLSVDIRGRPKTRRVVI